MKIPADVLVEGGGFIVDPMGGPEGAGVSVFHQLHCLVSFLPSCGRLRPDQHES